MGHEDGRRIDVRSLSMPQWILPVAAAGLALSVAAVVLMSDGGDKRPVGPSAPTLSVGEETVHAGDVIELRVQASESYIWGVPTSLEESQGGQRKSLYYWGTWAGENSQTIEPVSASEGNMFAAIGFAGPASFMIQVPDVEPGEYLITKTFIKNGTGSVKERTITSRAQLTVLP